jgi:hypothetical protein
MRFIAVWHRRGRGGGSGHDRRGRRAAVGTVAVGDTRTGDRCRADRYHGGLLCGPAQEEKGVGLAQKETVKLF